MCRTNRRAIVHRLLLVCLAFILAGCRQLMADQPRYNPDAPSDFLPNGQAAQPLQPGTIARGQLQDNSLLYTGKSAAATGAASGTPEGTPETTPGAGSDATDFPFPITFEVLQRGQDRFNIYCAPCHSRLGDGTGMVVQRGFTAPPSFHIDRLRQAPVGHFFDVITNGWGAMPSYASQIPVRDRWAIIAYIRALQFSQDAPAGQLPPEDRSKLPTIEATGAPSP